MKFYYAGQTAFGNRGCEALIRSHSKIIREIDPTATFLCPSFDAAADARQWPNAAASGVEFVSTAPYPTSLKLWNRVTKSLPWTRSFLAPLPFTPDASTISMLKSVDVVLMSGGDIVSLDYDLFSLHYWAGLVDAAARLGKPVHLLAASVGPFSKDPITERQMVAHLKRYTSITVRETASLAYLQSLGVEGSRLVADPAFVLDPEPWDVSDVINEGRDHVGFNVSPLVRAVRADEQSRERFDSEIKAFIKAVVERGDEDVVLIPHVDPLGGSPGNNSDRAYMGGLLEGLEPQVRTRVRITPDLLNAAQIKYLLGKCRYFIGARTHATIGAISQRVPTVSIAYSVKALGINKDLFGSTKYVLPTPDVSAATLGEALELLRAEEVETQALLAEKLPTWRDRARSGIGVILT